jgi:hypothetical protein
MDLTESNKPMMRLPFLIGKFAFSGIQESLVVRRCQLGLVKIIVRNRPQE